MAGWEILTDATIATLVLACRLGHGGSVGAEPVRRVLTWAADLVGDGPAGDRRERDRLAQVLCGECVICGVFADGRPQVVRRHAPAAVAATVAAEAAA